MTTARERFRVFRFRRLTGLRSSESSPWVMCAALLTGSTWGSRLIVVEVRRSRRLGGLRPTAARASRRAARAFARGRGRRGTARRGCQAQDSLGRVRHDASIFRGTPERSGSRAALRNLQRFTCSPTMKSSGDELADVGKLAHVLPAIWAIQSKCLPHRRAAALERDLSGSRRAGRLGGARPGRRATVPTGRGRAFDVAYLELLEELAEGDEHRLGGRHQEDASATGSAHTRLPSRPNGGSEPSRGQRSGRGSRLGAPRERRARHRARTPPARRGFTPSPSGRECPPADESGASAGGAGRRIG